MGIQWLESVYGSAKPIVAMCHLDALPGDPSYDRAKGMGYVIDRAYENLRALQDGGVDAVMFSNEFSLPYLTKTDPITAIAMARIIGELKSELFNLRFRHASGQLDNPMTIAACKKDIARVNTVLRERELKAKM